MAPSVNLLDAVERRTAVSVMDDALAQIARLNAKNAIRAERVNTDSRRVFLLAWADFFRAPAVDQHGMAGAAQVFANITRPDQLIAIRARALADARLAQIDGRHGWARDMLAKAARLRAEYQRRIARSALPATLSKVA